MHGKQARLQEALEKAYSQPHQELNTLWKVLCENVLQKTLSLLRNMDGWFRTATTIENGSPEKRQKVYTRANLLVLVGGTNQLLQFLEHCKGTKVQSSWATPGTTSLKPFSTML